MRLAATAAAVVVLAACSSEPEDAQQSSTTQSADEQIEATGAPDQMTVVDPSLVTGLAEKTRTEEKGGAQIDVAYPAIPNAAPLTDQLKRSTNREVSDFLDANPGAERIAMSWEVTVTGEDIVGVRLTREETDSRGPRTAHSTYWYDATSGQPAFATELLAGQKQLETLNKLVKEELADQEGVDTASIYPILRLYDSLGFNPRGELVVEFDEGQVAPVDTGRVHAVISAEDVAPLLSELGKRAQEEAQVLTADFALPDTSPSVSPSDSSAGSASPSAAGSSTPSEPPASPSPSGTTYGAVPGVLPVNDDEVDCSAADTKCVALTFDDGPGGGTPHLLDTLAEYDAKATFFVTGGPVREHARIVRREYAEGHEVANHTVKHPDLRTLSTAQIRGELAPVNALVRRETGYSMELMRPPYGATNGTVASVTKDMGLAQIIWSIDTNDWRDRDAGIVADRAVSRAKPGAIILMHDIHSTTIDAVPSIVEQLSQQGYTMVTISELLGDTDPGKRYFKAGD
ncbi:polysaccharide deacetylase family protein [Salinactinospora qingdaonensis]